LHYPQLGSEDNGGEKANMVERVSCCNCENARIGEDSKGFPNHYIMGKCCHKKSSKKTFYE
jgi:hypothetical protein